MREIGASVIADTVADLCKEANYRLEPDVKEALYAAKALERSPVGQIILLEILDNADLADREGLAMCQDTGTVIAFVEVGQDVHISGGTLTAAINAGVARGYKEGYLRNSMLGEPLFDRKNTGNNTPAIIHTDVVPGDRLTLKIMTKGGGAENMSRLAMLKPADGLEGVKRFVLETVAAAGPNACPPLVVGIGVGGNFETCALLAKRSLLRPVGALHPDPRVADLELELREKVNLLGIGPQGLGGTVTALAVNIEVMGCHIAALPVAVNVECHSHRHKEIVL